MIILVQLNQPEVAADRRLSSKETGDLRQDPRRAMPWVSGVCSVETRHASS